MQAILAVDLSDDVLYNFDHRAGLDFQTRTINS